ncbi:CocE/NonD family hydrolase [Granulicella sp. S190]|uniref:CocE/NonD family hydrolase n=1 Tax=Granulicella sp. S190 TaxID=1747226 RepID=UPI00131D03B1|nr:CocE/NonD family hydrolase [Granulicella sp. S190]
MTSPLIDCGQGVRLQREVPCTLSDGTILYSDHYYPAKRGPHPTLLMRQPYGRDIASTVVYAHPVWFARHGYNVVIQDVRGRGDSTGDFYPFLHEQKDGVETIAWLRTLPECNGKIGMYGFSYQGMTQWLAAAALPEGLLCIAPAQTAHDLYHGWFYNHGALRLASSLGWGLQMLKMDARRLQLREASDVLEHAWPALSSQILHTPAALHPAINSTGLPSYVVDWLQHDHPGEYWSQMDISGQVEKIEIPALHLSGWYDTYLHGSIAGFREIRRRAASHMARDNQYLLAGPWAHIPWGNRIGTQNFGANANFDTDEFHLRWFNHWLKGSGEFAEEPRIRYFAMNQNQWHTASAWPLTNHTLYLHSKGRANSSKGDGTLTIKIPDQSEPDDIFVVDPEVPVIAPGGITSMGGSHNQAALELGNNLLTYTTAPFSTPLHLFGTPAVTLFATTSAPFADLVVKLVCLRPKGEADFICIGVARSTFLFPSAAVTYKPDAPHEWRFDLEPTAWVFAPGESLRIEIAGSAYPLYDRNPGTATPPAQATSWDWQRSTHTIHHDLSRPSALHLPIVEDPTQ